MFVICFSLPLAGCLKQSVNSGELPSQKTSDVVESSLLRSTSNSVDLPKEGAAFQSYLVYAVAASPEISSLKSSELEAQSKVALAVAKTRPQVKASSLLGGYLPDMGDVSLEQGASVSLTASQLIFDGGRVTGNVKFAELELNLAKANTATAINKVSAEAASAAVAYSSAQIDLEAVKDFKSEIQPHVDQLERMAQSGLVDRSILDEATARLIEVEILEEEAFAAVKLTRVEYSRYFGELPLPKNLNSYPLPVGLEKSLSHPVEESPVVIEKAIGVLMAGKRLSVARSDFFPIINAQVGATSPMDPRESASGQLGVTLSYIINDGGSRKASILAAEKRLEKSHKELEITIETTTLILSSLREKTSNLKKVLSLEQKKMPMLVDQLVVAQTQIQTGQADTLKVLLKKSQLFNLKRRIRKIQADLLEVQYQLAANLGLFSK